MKILVVSDSHASMGLMRKAIEGLSPDAVIHLGDYYEDAQAIQRAYHRPQYYMVPGNCDRYRTGGDQPEILVQKIDGVLFYMTHGHRHSVKSYLHRLTLDAAASGADVVLYGHTHRMDCRIEGTLHIMNPGTCSTRNGSCGLIITEQGSIKEFRILTASDLEVAT